MFPEPGGAWRATVADVTAPGRYFVRTRGARSRQFGYGLITVPEIRDVKFRVTPPAYTRRPPYEGPLPQNGLAGLPGTKVEVWAKSNRPLSAGAMTFTPAAGEDTAASDAAVGQRGGEDVDGPVAMTPIGAGASEVERLVRHHPARQDRRQRQRRRRADVDATRSPRRSRCCTTTGRSCG